MSTPGLSRTTTCLLALRTLPSVLALEERHPILHTSVEQGLEARLSRLHARRLPAMACRSDQR